MKLFKKYVAWLLILATLATLLSSCGVGKKRVVGLCGDYEVLYEEVRFEALTYLQENPNCGEEELRAAVEQAIRERYAVLELCREYTPEASLESEELKELAKAEQKKAIAQLGSKKDFKAYLKEAYLTKNLLQKLLMITQMQVDLETAMFADTELANKDTLLAWLKDGNCARIRKITFTDAEAAAEAMTKLRNGTTIDELKKTDLLANSYVSQPDYYFRNLNNTPEEAAAMALEQVGDVSDVATINGKYYLFIREENKFENLENYQVSTALERYRENQLSPIIAEKAASLELSWNKAGAKLVLKDIK